MLFKEELATIAQNALEEKALTFALNIQSELKKAATEGACELLISVEPANEKWARNVEFINMVSNLLEGVNIELVEKRNALFPSYSVFNSKHLRFYW